MKHYTPTELKLPETVQYHFEEEILKPHTADDSLLTPRATSARQVFASWDIPRKKSSKLREGRVLFRRWFRVRFPQKKYREFALSLLAVLVIGFLVAGLLYREPKFGAVVVGLLGLGLLFNWLYPRYVAFVWSWTNETTRDALIMKIRK